MSTAQDEGGDPAAVLAGQIAEAVEAVTGVVGLHGGMFGEVATYLPGGRVTGVRIGERSTEVHIAVAYGHDIRQVAHTVQQTVAELTSTPVDVTVEDLQTAPAAAAPGSEPR